MISTRSPARGAGSTSVRCRLGRRRTCRRFFPVLVLWWVSFVRSFVRSAAFVFSPARSDQLLTISQAIDFLEKCLTFSPKRRIEVGEALQHPYLAVSVLFLSFRGLGIWYTVWTLDAMCGGWALLLCGMWGTPVPLLPLDRWPTLQSALLFRIELCIADSLDISQPYHDPQDEPTADPIDPSFFDFDNGEQSGKEALKGEFFIVLISSFSLYMLQPLTELIYEEITRPYNQQSTMLLW